MLEIRQATADDLDAVRQLLHDTWHATYDATMGVEVVNDITARWHSAENLSRQLSDPDGCFLVAETPDGIIAGHAGAVRQAADVVCLTRLYVLPKLQGDGAGTALLTAVTDWAGQGVTIELEVETANTPAIGFYRRHGFSDDGRQVQCGGDPAAGQAIVMKRRVS
ncbi:GNAT family N-acetyltransferase [Anderseniella sp. Alg231-50]|uniref:GNAT family N-acetyltransferase n=1 Tax=Anderseniella sp. Alg231-50 TaxID=1922226 RepID=UPI000D55D512